MKEGYRAGLVSNPGLFKLGQVSPNRGRTLEPWVGEARAKEIREKMSKNSAGKAPFLRLLNSTPGIAAKRVASRRSHDDLVTWLADSIRSRGHRVFVLSECAKEKRIPDAIVFDGSLLIAVEVETEKKRKPSHRSTI